MALDQHTARRAAMIAVAVYLCGSLLAEELYPFSAATMFSFSIEVIDRYDVQDPYGHNLGSQRFALQICNPHDAPSTSLGRNGYGRRSLPTMQGNKTRNPYGVAIPREDINAHVRSVLRGPPRTPDGIYLIGEDINADLRNTLMSYPFVTIIRKRMQVLNGKVARETSEWNVSRD